jgi:carboxypeptidase family protein
MSRVQATTAFALASLVALGCQGATGPTGPGGPTGPSGPTGPTGTPGTPGVTIGTISGVVRDGGGTPVAGVAVQTVPQSASATTGADGHFTLAGVTIGSYSVVASKTGYTTFTLANVGVIAGGTTQVVLAVLIAPDAPGTVSGTVTDSKNPPTPLAGVTVSVPGTSATATTAADGSFTVTGVPPGPVFLSAAAPSASYLDTETREAVFVPPGQDVTGVNLVLSARPSDSAQYRGMSGVFSCSTCHSDKVTTHQSSAHYRSLTRIQRNPSNGHAVPGAFARVLNATLTAPRVVMVPLAGTVSADTSSAVITGTGTAFDTDLLAGDVLGYTPVGLGWQRIGAIATVDTSTQVTLTANATLAPGTKVSGSVKYSVARLSRSYTHMLPEDANDIVAPAWPGVKATNPNYDANDPCIYGNAPSGTCAEGGTTKYADGQVNVYLCNLKDGVTFTADEYVQKFGGSAYTCSDGAFWDGVTVPAVPMVHIDVVYGGQGDKDGAGAPHKNMGVFKQRFQGRLADIRAADGWTYTAGKDVDSLTLPIQFLESGDKVNGGFKMNGYHPTEQKFPGESWTQRTRTFSHACAGCHNTGFAIAWDTATVTLPFGRDGAPNNSPMQFAAIKSYSFIDENITCEQCHGPGSEHMNAGGGRGRSIINPKYLTAEGERQLCGKCHAYDDATNAVPAQDYGFEYPWNSDHAGQIGGGEFIAGVYNLPDFFDNWEERQTDDEALWDPGATGGKLYGQAHRQQYIMLAQSQHTNNPYLKATCTSCHDHHSQFLGTTDVRSAQNDQFQFVGADFRNNVLCLSCHAGFGDWAAISKDDVANVHTGAGGAVTKNGAAVAPSADDIYHSGLTVSQTVGQHMFQRANMFAPYNPTADATPVGRCTSCHMPKLAKSGGYVTGNDGSSPANKALVEGDQASHYFNIVWPWESNALSRGGPTFQSGYYGQQYSSTNVKYDAYGFMPNSCSKCHESARRASIFCPDQSAVWPAYWPFSEHPTDPFWSACVTSSQLP